MSFGGSISGFRCKSLDVSHEDRDLIERYGGVVLDVNTQIDWSHSYEESGFTYYVIPLNGVDFEFVKVPGRKLFFGLGGRDPGYFMMSHWVTQGQWLAVMGVNPAAFAGRGLDLPIESVSYNDIVNHFLPRLNGLLQEAGFEGEFQLPSNDQWQRMADKNVALDFALNKSKYSDFGQSSHSGQPIPVKSKVRGKLGAWMFGGVWEFVGIFNAYGFVDMGGGGWCSGAQDVGPCSGDWFRCDDRYHCRYVGFRLLRTFP
ncbi:MAG: hypothetical protein AB8C84_08625 [Oligoflexales bacterium]